MKTYTFSKLSFLTMGPVAHAYPAWPIDVAMIGQKVVVESLRVRLSAPTPGDVLARAYVNQHVEARLETAVADAFRKSMIRSEADFGPPPLPTVFVTIHLNLADLAPFDRSIGAAMGKRILVARLEAVEIRSGWVKNVPLRFEVDVAGFGVVRSAVLTRVGALPTRGKPKRAAPDELCRVLLEAGPRRRVAKPI